MAPRLGEMGSAAMADVVTVAAPAQMVDDGMTKVQEMIKKLKSENLASLG